MKYFEFLRNLILVVFLSFQHISFGENIDLVICSFDQRIELYKGVQDNHHQYSSRYGYGYINGSNLTLAMRREPNWAKLKLVWNSLSKYEWVLWLDSDAIIINMSKSITEIISEQNIDISPNRNPPLSFIFSGDTNAINSGVFLVRRTNWTFHMLGEVWKIGGVLGEANVKIGMGTDNAAFSIFINGCTSSSSIDEMRKCYLNVDLGAGHREASDKIRLADPEIYKRMVPNHIRSHLQPIPQNVWNCYEAGKARFILHFAGILNKYPLIQSTLKSFSQN